MDFALPASLFVATATTPRSMLLGQWPLFGHADRLDAVALRILLLATAAVVRLALGRRRRSRRWTIALPNYAAAGLPLISAVFGADHTIYVALAIAAGSIFPSPLTLAILEANKATEAGQQKNVGAIAGAIGRSLRKPIVLGPVIGILFSLAGIPLATRRGPFAAVDRPDGGGCGAVPHRRHTLRPEAGPQPERSSAACLLKNVVHPLLACRSRAFCCLSTEKRPARLSCWPPCRRVSLVVLFGLRYGRRVPRGWLYPCRQLPAQYRHAGCGADMTTGILKAVRAVIAILCFCFCLGARAEGGSLSSKSQPTSRAGPILCEDMPRKFLLVLSGGKWGR